MYCSNCKQDFDGNFCPECGTKLIEKPSANGLTVDGSGNAIDMHTTNQTITHDNSVTNNVVNNTDHSVTNNTTQNITYQAQLTSEQIKAKNREKFMQAVADAIQQRGQLDAQDQHNLRLLQLRLGLLDDEAVMLSQQVKATYFKLDFQQVYQAAQAGDADAMNKLGAYYEMGRGVAPDRNMAITLYSRAKQMGSIKAQQNLDRLLPLCAPTPQMAMPAMPKVTEEKVVNPQSVNLSQMQGFNPLEAAKLMGIAQPQSIAEPINMTVGGMPTIKESND